MTSLSVLARLHAEATPGRWFIVGDPWNTGAPYINAGSEDPHQGTPVCDFIDWRGDQLENLLAEENAALICAAVNALPALLAIAEAAEQLIGPWDGRISRTGEHFDALRAALGRLETETP